MNNCLFLVVSWVWAKNDSLPVYKLSLIFCCCKKSLLKSQKVIDFTQTDIFSFLELIDLIFYVKLFLYFDWIFRFIQFLLNLNPFLLSIDIFQNEETCEQIEVLLKISIENNAEILSFVKEFNNNSHKNFVII